MKVMKHSTLYRQNSKGTLQQWTISVRDTEITTEYGLVGGKLQTTVDIVKKGKNIGRSNETTAIEQAFVETQQQFDAKVKEGYQPDQSLALTTKNTLEAVECMLAHPIENKLKYVKFPGLAQPKLDGARCLAIMKKGKVKLWSRTQKQWVASPHIVAEIESIYGYLGNTILDGELYNHAYKNNFNYIMSLIKREDVHPDHKAVQYHIYDVIDEGNWKKRTAILNALVPTLATYCVKVETVVVNSQDELEQYQAQCVENGYEGCIYRNPEAPYEHKRSSGLLKVKSFKDDEFKIVDVEEGRGKLMGKVGAFYCKLKSTTCPETCAPRCPTCTFKAKPMGTLDHVKDLWKNRKECIGEMATVKYQNLTPDGMPRFPVLKCIRDYE